MGAPGRAPCSRWIEAGRRGDEDFTVYMSLNERPSVDLYRRFVEAGVTDLYAPLDVRGRAPGTPDEGALATRLPACHGSPRRSSTSLRGAGSAPVHET